VTETRTVCLTEYTYIDIRLWFMAASGYLAVLYAACNVSGLSVA